MHYGNKREFLCLSIRNNVKSRSRSWSTAAIFNRFGTTSVIIKYVNSYPCCFNIRTSRQCHRGWNKAKDTCTGCVEAEVESERFLN